MAEKENLSPEGKENMKKLAEGLRQIATADKMFGEEEE